MKIIQTFKEGRNNLLKEMQENRGKQIEALKEEKNILKEIQEDTIQKVKELNKGVQDVKMEVETISHK